MEDYGRVLRWLYDPANRKEAVALTAGYLKRPPAAFDGWLFTKKDFFRDMDGKPDLKVVQSSIDKVKELGFHQGAPGCVQIRRFEPGRGGRQTAALTEPNPTFAHCLSSWVAARGLAAGQPP